jgi:hypothetical protein
LRLSAVGTACEGHPLFHTRDAHQLNDAVGESDTHGPFRRPSRDSPPLHRESRRRFTDPNRFGPVPIGWAAIRLTIRNTEMFTVTAKGHVPVSRTRYVLAEDQESELLADGWPARIVRGSARPAPTQAGSGHAGTSPRLILHARVHRCVIWHERARTTAQRIQLAPESPSARPKASHLGSKPRWYTRFGNSTSIPPVRDL